MALEADRFMALALPPGKILTSTLFLHARRNSHGQERLVYVTCNANITDPDLQIEATVFVPGGAFKDPVEANIGFGPPINLIQSNGKPVRFFTGQAEADDASFLIPLEIGGKRTCIEGWLRDDDTVNFRGRFVETVQY